MQKPDSIETALRGLQRGRMVILVDDAARENEGDLVLAAQKATVKNLNFMAQHARGLMCVPLTRERANQLDLPMMTDRTDAHQTAFTVSVDHKNAGTGISIPSRLQTVKALASSKTKPRDLARPGHLFPLIARDGGVLERAGHTEGAVDLLKLANLEPTAIICEILHPDGKMARMNELRKLSKKWNLPLVSIHDLIAYRIRHEKSRIVKRAAPMLETGHGKFRAHVFADAETGDEYLALEKGNVRGKKNVLVRVHSACLTGDVFGSLHCDCGPQLEAALRQIARAREGVLLYIPHHEGRGIGLSEKLKAYELQARGKDTVDANLALGFPMDKRDYGTGARILREMGLSTIRILTNNPKKLVGLSAFGLSVTRQIPLRIKPNRINRKYLATKKEKMGHLL